ncbi:MAG TPA: VOC family protein [Gemmatimonadaceae bacterium]|nr:VOC family protein [Gemmatimonadaceae bacterium]
MHLNTQLNFGGNCEEAFQFYERHLGGKITAMIRKDSIPPGHPRPPGPDSFVIHARVTIGGVDLIGNDVPSEVYQPVRGAYLFLDVDSNEEADRVFALLAEGGQVGTPIAEAFFATRFGQVRDRFGVLWSVIGPRRG